MPDNLDAELLSLMRLIASGDAPGVSRLLFDAPKLAAARLDQGAEREGSQSYFLEEIGQHIYAGAAALHVAAAGYRTSIVQQLLDCGADVGVRDRRGAQPLHTAAVGHPGSGRWDPEAQVATIELLLAAGTDPDAVDKFGVTALHRAVRTRAAAAVEALLTGGADVNRRNKSGSTPLLLATQNTGRSGSGSLAAKEQQREILRILGGRGATLGG